MFPIPFVRPQGRVAAVVDVGSASAGVAVGVLRGSSFTIVASATAEVVGGDRTREHTRNAVSASLKEATEKARAAYALTPSFATHGAPRIGCGIIEPPWIRTCAVGADKAFEDGTHITKDIVSELAREALAGECISPGAIETEKIFEATTVRVELNGYPTGKPAGKYARHAAIHAIVSSADEEIRAAVESALISFGIEKPMLRSSARALFSVARRMADIGEEYVLAHLGDGALFLLVVRGGIPEASHAIPIGLQEIVRRVSGGSIPEETLSLFSLIGRDACTEEACAAFQAALQKFEPDFVRVVGEGMSDISGGRKLPECLVLHADARIAGWLSHVLSRIDLEQFTVTAHPFSVRPLALSNTLVSEGDNLQTPPSLKIAAALVSLEARE